MRETSYTDDDGRRWAVSLPDGVPESDAALGIPLGPPSLAPLGLPLDVEVRIHNQLFGRRLFTPRDVKTRRMEILGALQAALGVDIVAIAALYRVEEPAAVSAKAKQTKRTKQTKAPKRGQRRKRRR
jgi:hypothetical protein